MISLTTVTGSGTQVTVYCLSPKTVGRKKPRDRRSLPNTVDPDPSARLGDWGCDDVPMFHANYPLCPWPLPPWPIRPPARLGQIVWPCWGVSRYAVGHVVVSTAAMAAIAAVPNWLNNLRLDVTLTDNRNAPFSLRMNALAWRPYNDPHAIPQTAIDTSVEQAWVITLVDFRGIFLESGSSVNATTWGDAIHQKGLSMPSTVGFAATDINTMLGLQSPAYPNPLRSLWDAGPGLIGTTNDYYYADAACAAVNLRIAVDKDGTCIMNDAATASTSWAAWLSAWQSRSIRGGVVNSALEKPETLRFTTSAIDAQYTQYNQDVGALGWKLVTEVDIQYTSAGDSNYRTRFFDDVGRWFAVNQAEIHFAGLLPVPATSIPYSIIYTDDGDTVETRIQKGPVGYPLPLIGNFRTNPALAVSIAAALTADVTNATTTLSSLSDLSVTLKASTRYVGKLVLFCNNSIASEGIKIDFAGGTATATQFKAAASQVLGGAVVLGTVRTTTLAGVINFTTITGETVIEVNYSFLVNAGGTFIPRFAENTHAAGTVTAELGSSLTSILSSN